MFEGLYTHTSPTCSANKVMDVDRVDDDGLGSVHHKVVKGTHNYEAFTGCCNGNASDTADSYGEEDSHPESSHSHCHTNSNAPLYSYVAHDSPKYPQRTQLPSVAMVTGKPKRWKGTHPDWLEELTTTDKFFKPCRLCSPVKPGRDTLVTFFDLDDPHGDGACTFCRHSHEAAGHRLLQIRRSTHHDVVKCSDIAAYTSIEFIQPYVINSCKVVFLQPRPQPRPPRGISMPSKCIMDSRQLMDNGTKFCSLRCKIDYEQGKPPAKVRSESAPKARRPAVKPQQRNSPQHQMFTYKPATSSIEAHTERLLLASSPYLPARSAQQAERIYSSLPVHLSTSSRPSVCIQEPAGMEEAEPAPRLKWAPATKRPRYPPYLSQQQATTSAAATTLWPQAVYRHGSVKMWKDGVDSIGQYEAPAHKVQKMKTWKELGNEDDYQAPSYGDKNVKFLKEEPIERYQPAAYRVQNVKMWKDEPVDQYEAAAFKDLKAKSWKSEPEDSRHYQGLSYRDQNVKLWKEEPEAVDQRDAPYERLHCLPQLKKTLVKQGNRSVTPSRIEDIAGLSAAYQHPQVAQVQPWLSGQTPTPEMRVALTPSPPVSKDSVWHLNRGVDADNLSSGGMLLADIAASRVGTEVTKNSYDQEDVASDAESLGEDWDLPRHGHRQIEVSVPSPSPYAYGAMPAEPKPTVSPPSIPLKLASPSKHSADSSADSGKSHGSHRRKGHPVRSPFE